MNNKEQMKEWEEVKDLWSFYQEWENASIDGFSKEANDMREKLGKAREVINNIIQSQKPLEIKFGSSYLLKSDMVVLNKYEKYKKIGHGEVKLIGEIKDVFNDCYIIEIDKYEYYVSKSLFINQHFELVEDNDNG
ncbi:hypothetical protein LJC02_01795 [Breznakia sp. OttesenSCG-928-G09]|nr:hypothetical protein [Breznakia sp. OttesenSCG-928-G09]